MSTALQHFRRTYLVPAFDHASVADVMRPGIIGCPAGTPLTQVAEMMATHRVHAVVVAGTRLDPVHGEQLVWGFLSDADLVRAACDGGIEGLTAGIVAHTEAPTVEPSTPLAAAARIMDEHRVAHLVVASGGHPVGIISTLDIAGALAWGGVGAS
jgi:signal-transduction protein with cAMP-binding, CBS, and nucleotidyltransferase domain